MSEVRPHHIVPEAVEAVVLKALSKEPDDRYATTLELRQALLDAVESDATDDSREIALPDTEAREPRDTVRQKTAMLGRPSSLTPRSARPTRCEAVAVRTHSPWRLLALGLAAAAVSASVMLMLPNRSRAEEKAVPEIIGAPATTIEEGAQTSRRAAEPEAPAPARDQDHLAH